MNNKKTALSSPSIDSTRATGDAIKDIIAENFENIVAGYCRKYSADFGQKAMGNFAFEDEENNYYLIDVTTHNVEKDFSMPNLTSVYRLAKFYCKEKYGGKNYFILLIPHYKSKNLNIDVEEVDFVPIENLDWSCLTFSASGTGQIQIADAKNIKINRDLKRKDWMLQFCDKLAKFYPMEIKKIEKRIKFVKQTRAFWQKWPD